MDYFKIYKTSVPNAKKTLDIPINISGFIAQINDEKLRNNFSKLLPYDSLHFWDFGVRAASKLKKGMNVSIISGTTKYDCEIVDIIEDHNGELGDLFDWTRLYDRPWKNVCALTIQHKESFGQQKINELKNESIVVAKSFYRRTRNAHDSTRWTDEELEESIKAYAEIYRREHMGQNPVKTDYYRTLSDKFGRTEKSFEFRMQNISSVLADMGLPWISGLKPAKNVGTNVKDRITDIIRNGNFFEAELLEATISPDKFEKKVSELLKRGKQQRPKGSEKPNKKTTSTEQYARNPAVKVWILSQANGCCECCTNTAPFFKSDGEPYLELHHVKSLADGGSDTISNAVALCPNCHRMLHYARDAGAITNSLYNKIIRLIKE